MMTLVACDDPGLVILPTHRVVRHLDPERSRHSIRGRGIFAVEEFAAPI